MDQTKKAHIGRTVYFRQEEFQYVSKIADEMGGIGVSAVVRYIINEQRKKNGKENKG